jgi:multidrug efflux pump subunit AcrA (membrane-fusion protein)
MKSKNCHIIISLLLTLMAVSCSPKEEQTDETTDEPVTPVTAVSVNMDTLTEYIELNATTVFLQKSYIKSNVNGYLQSADTRLGQYVTRGQNLFTVKTKESQSIGNALSQLDSSFKFSGVNRIHADANGYITQLNHQGGDYVQDGEQLAVISNMNSFVFLLDLPYELQQYVLNRKPVQVILPGGEKLDGYVESFLPTVDAASQTQSIVIRVASSHTIPENLIAKVRIIKNKKINAISLPRSALLTNETQNEFWVMKMTDSTTAVKVPVQKGIETADRVEIISPRFNPGDAILVSGNYGLPDTAKVKLEQISDKK